MIYYVFNKFLKTRQNLPLNFGYLHFSVSSSTLMTASWLASLVPAESRRILLSIGRSEPRFESHRGGKIGTNLKNNKHFDGFCFFFFWLNQIQNCFGKIKKMKDEISSFELKKITSFEH